MTTVALWLRAECAFDFTSAQRSGDFLCSPWWDRLLSKALHKLARAQYASYPVYLLAQALLAPPHTTYLTATKFKHVAHAAMRSAHNEAQMSVVRVDRCFVAKQNLIADVTWVSNGVF